MRGFLLCLALSTAGVAQAETVAPADVLSLRVTDWLPVEGELREWTAITGTYPVAADGRASFPYVGEIAVAGLSPVEIGETIGEALKQRFALADRPDASVTIAERRPVLVGGAVRTPGEVPFASGMTARHAVALAGGTAPLGGDGSSAMLQLLTSEAQVRILSGEEAVGRVRVARLRAELDGAAKLPAGEGSEALRADAERLLALRQERLTREVELIDSRIALLNEEVVALGSKEEALNRQRALAEEGRAATADLAERGLAANVRLLDAEETLVTVETQLLDVATALLRARQQSRVAESERLELVQGRAADVMLELETAQADLAGVRERLALQRSLAVYLGAELGGEDAGQAGTVTVYRSVEGRSVPLPDGPDTVLEPGDLVEVTLPLLIPEGG